METTNKKRHISGILLLNKAQGITSNTALQKVKKLYRANKAGHTGSLDPLATGMLPLCFGEATKFSKYLLDADKAYRAIGCLGIKTDTADALGDVIKEIRDFSIQTDALQRCLEQFRGLIQQVPSMYSALKHQGRPLYAYAREGLEIERAARTIHIYQLDLLDFDGIHFTLDIRCSKGTYIRNLVEDIGEKLGVGAYLTALHREYTAGFAKDRMIDMDTLEALPETQRDALLKPSDAAVAWMPSRQLDASQTSLICQGRTIEYPELQNDQLYRLYNSDTDFIGIGQALSDHSIKPHRLIAAV